MKTYRIAVLMILGLCLPEVVMLAQRPPKGVVRSRDLRAVLVRPGAGVTVRAPGGGEILARGLLVLEDGARIKVPPKEIAILVCGNGQALQARGEVRVDARLCRGGVRVPGGQALVKPDAGRLRVVGRSLELLGDARGGPEEADPVLLAPRNTRLLTGRPTMRWTALQGASHYRISLNGPTRLTVDLKAEDVACGDEGSAGLAKGVCSWNWPLEKPSLTSEGTYFLEVQARRGVAGSWRNTQQVHRLEILDEKAAQGLRQRIDEIHSLKLDDFTRDLLTAGTYAQEGLFMDAIDLYARVVETSDIPELKVTLGDLYQEVGLYRQAGASYQQVIEREPSSEARAAAELGLGQLYAVWNQHRHALEHFECARAMFIKLGFPSEAEAVEKEAAKSRRKALN